MFSICYPFTEVDDIVFEVEGKLVSAGGAVDVDVGCGDAFGGGGDAEQLADAAETVINVVYSHRLVETSFAKSDFIKYIKAYMNRVKGYLRKTNPGPLPIRPCSRRGHQLTPLACVVCGVACACVRACGDTERVAPFMKSAEPFVMKMLKNFDEYSFYMGESMDAEAAIGFGFYRSDEASPTPRFYFFKDGLSLQHPGFGKSLEHPVQERA